MGQVPSYEGSAAKIAARKAFDTDGDTQFGQTPAPRAVQKRARTPIAHIERKRARSPDWLPDSDEPRSDSTESLMLRASKWGFEYPKRIKTEPRDEDGRTTPASEAPPPQGQLELVKQEDDAGVQLTMHVTESIELPPAWSELINTEDDKIHQLPLPPVPPVAQPQGI